MYKENIKTWSVLLGVIAFIVFIISFFGWLGLAILFIFLMILLGGTP